MMTPFEVAGVTMYELDELAGMMQTTVVSLRKFIRAGDLRARKLGGNKWVVSESAVREFLEAEDKRPGTRKDGKR